LDGFGGHGGAFTSQLDLTKQFDVGRSKSTGVGILSQHLNRLIAILVADPSFHLPREADSLDHSDRGDNSNKPGVEREKPQGGP
jgi:hypothetical protein